MAQDVGEMFDAAEQWSGKMLMISELSMEEQERMRKPMEEACEEKASPFSSFRRILLEFGRNVLGKWNKEAGKSRG
jgi:hypothetical protein